MKPLDHRCISKTYIFLPLSLDLVARLCSSSTCDCTSRSLWFTSLEIKTYINFPSSDWTYTFSLRFSYNEQNKVSHYSRSNSLFLIIFCVAWNFDETSNAVFLTDTLCWAGILVHKYSFEIHFNMHLFKWVLSVVPKDQDVNPWRSRVRIQHFHSQGPGFSPWSGN